MQPVVILQLLILLALANGTPVIAKKVFGNRFFQPLDGGANLPDGRPLFGPSKTIRGILLSILMTSAGAPLLGLNWKIGAVIGVTAMAGDLFSSFVKRRMNFAPSSKATGLDQVPEALFPLIACRTLLSLSVVDIAVGVAVFFVGEMLLSRLLYKIGIRDQPY